MSTTHTTTVRNLIADTVTAEVDSGGGAGNLVIMTAGDAEVATLVMSATAFGASVGGTASAAAITDDSSATGGTAALYKQEDFANVEKWRGSVTATGGGGDIEFPTVIIPALVTVQMTSFSYTAPT
jgi:hypothetical protein